MGSFHAPYRSSRGVLALLLVGFLPQSPLAVAQKDSKPKPQAKTSSNTKIPTIQLQVLLRPLTKADLEAELQGWLGKLKAKITEVSETELKIKEDPDGKSADALKEKLVELKKEETALVERTRIVLAALKAKGGKAETEEQYLNVVADITQATDTTSYWAALVAAVGNWFQSDTGGKLWGRRLLWAVILLLVFWRLSKVAGRLAGGAIAKNPKVSNLLRDFVRRTTGGLVMLIGILTALGALGVEIGPMLAALGAGGFIVGFAMQETLGSFASGLMIMIHRPFDVDDYVSVAGVDGTVKAMSMVSTTLLTPDNKVLIIPNKKAWGDTIVNFNVNETRRVDLVFGISYEDNVQQALDLLKKLAEEHPLVLKEPEVMVKVGELADSSVNLLCRPWVKTADYWTVYWDLMHQVKERFDAEGLHIPYPQQDVHVRSESAAS